MQQPAIEGWFTTGAEPHLIGSRCAACSTLYFPPTISFCHNPSCVGQDFDRVALSRRGTVWSYTDTQYAPPAPYISPSDPFVPFAIAAVELADEGLVVLGQLSQGVGVDDVRVGTEVELVVETLYQNEGVEHLMYRWKPVGA